jgi:3-oxoacyl-[acyl-carrier-protein] synthase-3
MSADKPRASFWGVGKYAPEKILTNADFEKMVETSDQWIVERTGMRERHVAAPDQAASDLGLAASQAALAAAGVAPSDLELIIVATVTPDYLFPNTACIIQDKLGVKNAGAFDLSAGCTGFVYACNTAAQFIENGCYQRILVVGVDALTKITDYADRNTCILFGDGAGAAVMGPARKDGGILATHMKADGSLGALIHMPGGGSRMPATHESVDARAHFIKMEGRETFKNAVRSLCESAEYVLARAGYKSEDLDLLIPHQANLRIMTAVADRLKGPPEKTLVNIDKYGNTSSGTIPIAMAEAVDQGRLKPGHLLLNVAFGSGLTWGAHLVRWE